MVLAERGQFDSQSACTHTALHELWHATGHLDRLNRATLVEHSGFGAETYAVEKGRVEIDATTTSEQLGVRHEPRHGTAYVSSWTKALENNPKEIRAAAVDAQRMSDWLLVGERERIPVEDRSAAASSGGGEPVLAQAQRQAVELREPSPARRDHPGLRSE